MFYKDLYNKEIVLTEYYRLHENISASDWLRVVQYWPYMYSVFNICTL